MVSDQPFIMHYNKKSVFKEHAIVSNFCISIACSIVLICAAVGTIVNTRICCVYNWLMAFLASFTNPGASKSLSCPRSLSSLVSSTSRAISITWIWRIHFLSTAFSTTFFNISIAQLQFTNKMILIVNI